MMKRRCLRIVEHAGEQLPQAHRIDRQQGQDGAELNQNREAFAEIVVAEAEKPLHQQEMPGRGHGNELGQPLDHAKDDRLNKIECHGSTPRRRGAGRRPICKGLARCVRRTCDPAGDSGNGQGRALNRGTPRMLPDGFFAYKKPTRSRAVCPAATVSIVIFLRAREHADTVSSSLLSAFPFRAAGPRGTRPDGAARRGTGLGAARGIPHAQSGGNDAGPGGRGRAADSGRCHHRGISR